MVYYRIFPNGSNTKRHCAVSWNSVRDAKKGAAIFDSEYQQLERVAFEITNGNPQRETHVNEKK